MQISMIQAQLSPQVSFFPPVFGGSQAGALQAGTLAGGVSDLYIPSPQVQMLQMLMALCQLMAVWRGTGEAGMASLPPGTMPVNGNASSGSFKVLPYDGQRTGGGMNPEQIHMTQVYDRRYNRGGAPRSADCGPTSLAMGLEALGLSPRGTVQDKVDAARLAMFRGADASRDGYDLAGRKSQAEHGTSTNISDWRRGAKAAGARTRDVSSVADVAREVSQGHPVMLAGRNAGNIYGRGHGIDFNGGHAILISGYDRASGTFILNDPLSHGGPIRVSRSQLAAFLWDGDGGGVDGIALMR